MYGSGAYGSTEYATSGRTAPDSSPIEAEQAIAVPLIALTMNLHAPEMTTTPRGEPIARDVRVLRIIDR